MTAYVNGHLTARYVAWRRSCYRTMLKDVLDRIEQRLADLDISATAASKAAGLSADAIRNMRRAVNGEGPPRHGVSSATLNALAPVLQVSSKWLLDGGPLEEDGEPLVPIIGRVGADAEGQMIHVTGQQSYDMVPVPPGGSTRSAAVLVTGDSMNGIADDGALVYFDNQRTPPTPDLIRYPCVVETEDGRVLFKRLLRGSKPGLYDLESIIGPTITDVRLHWAAEPTAIIPPRAARRLIRKSAA